MKELSRSKIHPGCCPRLGDLANRIRPAPLFVRDRRPLTGVPLIPDERRLATPDPEASDGAALLSDVVATR